MVGVGWGGVGWGVGCDNVRGHVYIRYPCGVSCGNTLGGWVGWGGVVCVNVTETNLYNGAAVHHV